MRSVAVLAAVLALALAGCVAPAAPSASAPAGGRIDGAVVDAFLSPHANTTVRIVELGWLDETNALGGFTFRNVPAGVYTVRADVAGQTDRQTVVVREGATTQTILQVVLPPAPTPHVAALRHEGHADLGIPGTTCVPCAWQTTLHERPDHVVLEARWDNGPLPGSPTRLVVELRDEAGRLVAFMEGQSPLQAKLMGSSIPADSETIEVRVYFHPANEAPHPGFSMQSSLCLFYAVSPDDGFGCTGGLWA